MNVITKAASKSREAHVSDDLGNLGLRRNDGTFNVPVTEALALHVAVSPNRRDGPSETRTATIGFSENRDNIHTDSGQLQALMKLTPGTTLHLSYDLSRNKAAGPNYCDLPSGVTPARNLVDPGNWQPPGCNAARPSIWA